ncbi:MAG: helix-turn-helix transcriptional regulator [Streptosporangiaceae bacterium]|jgi:transcriptional regulator with XRE-family HTH domain
MGRPQKQLERDGSPVREFAFWLRDLRKASGLTYEQLGKNAHYATSTVQAAATGRRLPTLRVTMAFAKACGGDQGEWRRYWTQVQRALDRDAPGSHAASIAPPWADAGNPGLSAAAYLGDRVEFPPASVTQEAADPAAEGPVSSPADAPEGWFIESFSALLRLDANPIEALEQRVAVATTDGLSELTTSVSVPRHSADVDQAHGLESELLHGGSLELREQPYESYFRNVIVLPRPLKKGERHRYAIRLCIPAGQRMAPHYVYVPFSRSDHFDLRVRFNPLHLPRSIWVLRGAPTAVIYERGPAAQTLTPDRFGEVHVIFHTLRQGLGYGVCWQD